MGRFSVASLWQRERGSRCGRDVLFLKRLERRHGRKKHTYCALVESIRTAKGSRHRVVACLGDLRRQERNGWAELGRRMDKKDRPHPSLFDPPHHAEPADDVELVKIQGVRRAGSVRSALTSKEPIGDRRKSATTSSIPKSTMPRRRNAIYLMTRGIVVLPASR